MMLSSKSMDMRYYSVIYTANSRHGRLPYCYGSPILEGSYPFQLQHKKNGLAFLFSRRTQCRIC